MDALIEFMKTHPDQASAFAAVSALFVSFISILLAVAALWMQRRHNYKSLTPIASLPIGDYENLIEVKLRNTGVGPLIVKKFTATKDHERKKNIVSFMPKLPEGIYWDTFYNDLEGLCVPPNETAIIIKLCGDPKDEKFAKFRDKVRNELKNVTIEVQYRDIYNRNMLNKCRDLKWFGRHDCK